MHSIMIKITNYDYESSHDLCLVSFLKKRIFFALELCWILDSILLNLQPDLKKEKILSFDWRKRALIREKWILPFQL